MSNEYSDTWFSVFLDTIPEAQTAADLAFLARQWPQPAYTTVLDLGCGPGRHARPLAARGYRVTGVDRSARALAAARLAGGDVSYVQGDMRDLAAIPGTFDAVLNLWQSFGYFDAATNTDVLRQIGARLRPGGRLVLDIYHRGFFETHQGERAGARAGRTFVERKSMTGDRLTVHLDYGTGEADSFEWQLYTPEELVALAAQLGLRPRVVCSGFDEQTPATADNPRMQLVFEKE